MSYFGFFCCIVEIGKAKQTQIKKQNKYSNGGLWVNTTNTTRTRTKKGNLIAGGGLGFEHTAMHLKSIYASYKWPLSPLK